LRSDRGCFGSLEQITPTPSQHLERQQRGQQLSDGVNWDVRPTAGAAHLRRHQPAHPNNDFAADTSFSGITFAPAAARFSIGGNRILLRGDITDNATAAQAISLGLALDGSDQHRQASPAAARFRWGRSFGVANQSANVSTLNINNTVTGSGADDSDQHSGGQHHQHRVRRHVEPDQSDSDRLPADGRRRKHNDYEFHRRRHVERQQHGQFQRADVQWQQQLRQRLDQHRGHDRPVEFLLHHDDRHV
jgi:hypothetical protein